MGRKEKLLRLATENLQQTLLINRNLPLINKTIEPRITDMVATCGRTHHVLTTITMKGVITDAAWSSAHVLWTPGHISRTGRDATMSCDGYVVVRNPRDNRSVLIVDMVVPPTMGNSGSQEIIKKWQSTYLSVTRNSQKFDASVDRNLTNDGYYAAIFRKVLGRKLSNSLSANIYSRYRVDFTSNSVGTEASDFVYLRLLAVNTSDEINPFCTSVVLLTLRSALQDGKGATYWFT